eukprot:CAMPEP_0197245688 /NCGR_PEP_ID=MMETSP1429-20130617/10401_1 /TAXON_ID=49237 /ORGANISM="Chaetoceros  sp., Strain UNC1202" /LENGTH=215 /DNA_ID=CAMNT_0042706229 /DNA_START=123 /DNA_END=770 /DNA_ORIENTATION=+
MPFEHIQVDANMNTEIAYGTLTNDFPDQSLSVHQSPNFPLYDPDSVFEIPRNIADGFLILLSGGLTSAKAMKEERKHKKKKSSGESTAQSPPEVDHSAIQLSFAALTDGNVIEATFGVKSTGGMKRSEHTSEIAFNNAKTAKAAIMDAAICSDSITQLAVETYVKCFRIVVTYHMNIESIGFLAWCVRHQKVRDAAIQDLVVAFEPLNEVLAASI